MNPNELARQSRSPAPSPTPRATSESPSEPVERPTPTSYAPDLEALLPSELRGIAMQRLSLPGSAVGTGGDMCSVVCPGEPHALAEALGVDVDQIDLAFALPDSALADFPRVGIVAYRVRGVATERLIPARLASMQREEFPDMSTELTVAGKPVTWATYSLLPNPTTMEYLYAHDDVLFRVIDEVDLQPGVAPPADTVLAIEALP